jgi:hypothetical protein
MAFSWSFITEVGVQFTNLSANGKQARLEEEISQTALTNRKPGITDKYMPSKLSN